MSLIELATTACVALTGRSILEASRCSDVKPDITRNDPIANAAAASFCTNAYKKFPDSSKADEYVGTCCVKEKVSTHTIHSQKMTRRLLKMLMEAFGPFG